MKKLALMLSESTKKNALIACLLCVTMGVSAQAYKGTPFLKDTPHAVPGVIQAEDFDKGGIGVAFSAVDVGKGSNKGYRADQPSAPISGQGDEIHLSDTSKGDWIKYTINVAKEGKYTVELFVSTDNKPENPKSMTVAFDDGDDLSTQSIVTQGWGSYEPMTFEKVTLTKGKHVMTLKNFNGGINIDKIEISR